MRKFSLFEKVYINCLIPFVTLKILMRSLCFDKKEKNAIRSGRPLTGVKKGAMSKDYSVEDVKKVGKKFGVTINDVLMTITSVSLKEYLEAKGDLKAKTIKLSMPISLREPPNTVEEFKLQNSFAMVTIPLSLYSDFESGLKKVKQQMDALKSSIEPFAMYFFVKLGTFLPTILSKLIAIDQANKLSLVFTNVPGPKTPLVFTGKKVDKLIFFAPALGSLSGSLSIVSHVNCIKIGCVSDESQIDDPILMIDLFNKNFEKALKTIKDQ